MYVQRLPFLFLHCYLNYQRQLNVVERIRQFNVNVHNQSVRQGGIRLEASDLALDQLRIQRSGLGFITNEGRRGLDRGTAVERATALPRTARTSNPGGRSSSSWKMPARSTV